MVKAYRSTVINAPVQRVWAAIRDFNAQHQRVKLCEYHGLKMTQPHPAAWHDQTYVLHDFEHSLYTVNITPSSDRYRQLPLAR